MRVALTTAVLLGTVFAVGCRESTSPTTPTWPAPVAALNGTGIPAEVLAVTNPSAASLDVWVAIPRGVDDAARNHDVAFSLQVSVTYISSNNTVETVTGQKSIKDETSFLADLDRGRVAVRFDLSIGATPPPGNNPGFLGTAVVVHP